MATKFIPSRIDVHEAKEYPIVLGDSILDTTRTSRQNIQFRYNWEPTHGFDHCNGLLKQSDDTFKLSYHKEKSSAPLSTYRGFHSTITKSPDESEKSRFVLVFDESRSAFVLERLSASIDFNATSAIELNKDELSRQQLLHLASLDKTSGTEARDEKDEDENADSSNPFDYRHFLTEAREMIEKPSLTSGNKTPLLGSSTPLGRISSPSLSSGRFTSSATLLPSSVQTTVSKKAPSIQPENKVKQARKGPVKRKEPLASKTRQPLSKDRISDSDEEIDDVKSAEPASTRGHARNTSTNSASRSNNIVRMEGGLEIDGGSPPREPQRRYKIDAEVFRSQTHTPVMGTSTSRRLPPSTHDEDIVMKDAGESDRDDSDAGDDDDVESIELDAQQPRKDDHEQPQLVDTPPAAAQMDDEDDAALEAELLEALEEEESAEGTARMNGYGHVEDDESEISEEE